MATGGDVSVKTSLTERMADMTYILQYTFDPIIRTTFPQYGPRQRLFGGPLRVDTTPFTAKGIVKKFQVTVPDNAINMGIIGDTSVWPSSWSQPGFTNLRLNTQHISDLAVKVRFDKRVKQMVESGEIGQAAAYLARMGADMLAFKTDILSITDRRAVVGTCANTAAASKVDDTTNSRFVFTLGVKQNVVMTQFKPGALLNAAADPTGHLPLATFRFYGSATTAAMMVVLDDPVIGSAIGENSTAYLTCTVAVPYTAENKTVVGNQVDALAVGDLIVPWMGPDANTDGTAAATEVIAGPGLMGLRHWCNPTWSGSVPTFANIEDAQGAIAAASVIQTDQEAPATVSRNSLPFKQFLNPLCYNGGGAAIATLMGKIDSIFLNLAVREGETVRRIVLVNPLMHQSMRAAVGQSNFRFMDNATDLMSVLNVKYGTSGFVYQGESSVPIAVGKHAAVPPDMVLCATEEPMFTLLSPSPPAWEPGGIGGMWEHAHSSAGATGFSLEAVRTQSLQMFPADNVQPREWAALVNAIP